jgi:hypothetical protein
MMFVLGVLGALLMTGSFFASSDEMGDDVLALRARCDTDRGLCHMVFSCVPRAGSPSRRESDRAPRNRSDSCEV